MAIHVEAEFLEDHKEQMREWTEFKTKYNLGEDPDVPNSCNRIKNHLETHFKHEELLYSQYRGAAGDLANLISVIREQHNTMTRILEGLIDGDFEDEEMTEKLVEFEKLLYAHIELEERQLYPELDRVLDESTKEHIVDDLKTETTHKEIM